MADPRFTSTFTSTLLLTLLTEFGDKTFLIAAVLSTNNPPAHIFAASVCGLWSMSVLSVCVGVLLAKWIPVLAVEWLAACLFCVFGVLMVLEGISSIHGGVNDAGECKEMIDSLSPHTQREDDGNENSKRLSAVDHSLSDKKVALVHNKEGAFTKTFVLTLAAEWGDRSQLATMAQSASKNAYGVVLGAMLGHVVCSALAVLFGSRLASIVGVQRVSVIGGCFFVAYGLMLLISRLH